MDGNEASGFGGIPGDPGQASGFGGLQSQVLPSLPITSPRVHPVVHLPPNCLGSAMYMLDGINK
jgi:hypothetical protein